MKPKLFLILFFSFSINGFSQCPVITVQPQPLNVICDNETFSVGIFATGVNLSYQWYHEGELLPDQDSPYCAVLGVSLTDAGTYYCVVSKNGCTAAISDPAVMVVTEAPHIIVQPQTAIAVSEGGDINLSIQATGSNLNYQWMHNGMDISGVNAPLLTIFAATIDDAGEYRCIVSNGSCPSAFSFVSTVEIINLGITTEVSKEFQLYPNPASGNVHFRWATVPGNKVIVSLIDVQGRKISESVFMEEGGILDVSKVQAGIYFVRITSGDESAVRKLIVK